MSVDCQEANKNTAIEMDQRLQTERVTPALLNYIVEKIVREIEPKQIILFGSRARGDDLDLIDRSKRPKPGFVLQSLFSVPQFLVTCYNSISIRYKFER